MAWITFIGDNKLVNIYPQSYRFRKKNIISIWLSTPYGFKECFFIVYLFLDPNQLIPPTSDSPKQN